MKPHKEILIDLELRKRKIRTLEKRIDIMSHSGRRIQNTTNKNKNYVMLILHQVELMTSNGFSIQLIPLKRLRRDISTN